MWTISDIDGKNERTVTLAQFRAELDARKPYSAAIMDATFEAAGERVRDWLGDGKSALIRAYREVGR